MGVKPETPLQQRIKRLIKSRGGYAQKNHGDMISEPGEADITAGYKGLYLAIEVKDGDNKPSVQQGIHCRQVLKAGCISLVVWSVEEVEVVLNTIDEYKIEMFDIIPDIRRTLILRGLDDGSKY